MTGLTKEQEKRLDDKIKFLDTPHLKVIVHDYFPDTHGQPYKIECSETAEKFIDNVNLAEALKKGYNIFFRIPEHVKATSCVMKRLFLSAFELCSHTGEPLDQHIFFDSKDQSTYKAWQEGLTNAQDWYNETRKEPCKKVRELVSARMALEEPEQQEQRYIPYRRAMVA